MGKGGIDCNMVNDNEILAVDSPKKSSGGDNYITGPYIIVGKDITDRWAVAALDLNDEPCLGIRWFTDENGAPISRGYPVWFILPHKLNQAILNSLSPHAQFIEIINDFLSEDESKLTGEELASIGSIKAICSLHDIDEQKTLALCYRCYNKIKKESNAENRGKEKRKIKEKLKETERRFNSPTAIFSKDVIVQEIEEFLEGISQ